MVGWECCGWAERGTWLMMTDVSASSAFRTNVGLLKHERRAATAALVNATLDRRRQAPGTTRLSERHPQQTKVRVKDGQRQASLAQGQQMSCKCEFQSIANGTQSLTCHASVARQNLSSCIIACSGLLGFYDCVYCFCRCLGL